MGFIHVPEGPYLYNFVWCIKLVEKGAGSTIICNKKVGEEIEIIAPLGSFKIDESSKNKDLIFIATGTGISPFISMIPLLLKNGFNKKIILISWFRNEKGWLYKQEFEQLEKKYKNFKYLTILSSPEKKEYKGEVGRVQKLIEKHIPENFKGDFYICGLKTMIDGVIKLLEEKGVSKNSIFFEKYD